MKKDLTEIIIVLDESGSMNGCKNDTIGGFNNFVESQKKLPGTAKLTLVKFNTEYDVVLNGIDIQNVQPLTDATYGPGGMTALLDATGRAIDEVGKRLASTSEDERPERVMAIIITDGKENSSREYTGVQIKEKVENQKKQFNWEFIFMGANIDAWSVGSSLGSSINVNFNVKDMSRSMKAASVNTAYHRSGANLSAKAYVDNFAMSDADLDKELEKLSKNDDKDNPKT